jgi:acetyl-CoA C-acetyltransferase/acetyl-CoA acyltransferase
MANEAGIARLPANTPYLRLVDYEIAAVDHHTEGLLMAPMRFLVCSPATVCVLTI